AAGLGHAGQQGPGRAGRGAGGNGGGDRAPVVLGIPLPGRVRRTGGGEPRRAGDAAGADGGVPYHQRGRDPQLLDPAPGREDGRDPRPGEHPAPARRPRRPRHADPRPVRGVLRPGACAHALRSARAGHRRMGAVAAGERGRRARGGGRAMSTDTAKHQPIDPLENAARLEELHRIWGNEPGIIGQLKAVNHSTVALRFIVTGFAFLVAGGVLGMFIRLQLAWFDVEVLDPQRFNQFVTMHGTTMMFLFAVPILEGFAMYLLPKMLGSRDLPFPRLSAFGYWCYLFGGLFLYSSFLFDAA